MQINIYHGNCVILTRGNKVKIMDSISTNMFRVARDGSFLIYNTNILPTTRPW